MATVPRCCERANNRCNTNVFSDLFRAFMFQSRIFGFKLSMSLVVLGVIIGSCLLRLWSLGASNLLVEEAYYWNYAQHLDFGYLDHPPMVALLIKLSTIVFGTNEFGVRFTTLLCWLIAGVYSYRLTELIVPKQGRTAWLLLAMLPFFFVQSLIITPDQPLIACWSAALYYLYQSVVNDQKNAWYGVGIAVGLGMLSKYSIGLLGLSTLIYIGMVPRARGWLLRKEPYVALLIVCLLFTPVLYWNATHAWVSFIFQSTRRLQAKFQFTLHHFFGVILLFLTPAGLIALGKLWRPNADETAQLSYETRRFLQVFTLVPLAVFAWFSLSHPIKFNWTGPVFLAIIPWIALLIANAESQPQLKPFSLSDTVRWMRLQTWLITSAVLLVGYVGMLAAIIFGSPGHLHQHVLKKFIAWDDLTQQLHTVAEQIANDQHHTPVFVSLDLYNIASELSFYQKKLLNKHLIKEAYPVIGRQLLGGESLMYRYWDANTNKNTLSNVPLILVSNERRDFDNSAITSQISALTQPTLVWAHSQGKQQSVKPYYYQVVTLKTT